MTYQLISYRCVGVVVFLIYGYLADATNLPSGFECMPQNYYSGGYDFYQVRNLDPEATTAMIEGARYFQRTTPHGIKMGMPTLEELVSLTATLDTSGTVKVSGFRNSMGDEDILLLPATWTGDALIVQSKLFHNDLISDGICSAH